MGATRRSSLLAAALLFIAAGGCSSDDEGSGGATTASAGSSGDTSATSTTGGGSTASATTSSADGPSSGTGGGGSSGGSTGSSGETSSTASGPGGGGAGGGAPIDEPCPALATPSSCFGREVMYREWGADAVGDGSYFADQAPYRLGFNRVQGRMWVVKFQLEENTYTGRISAYGDSSAGVTWIARGPCETDFAIDSRLVSWGLHGGGDLSFVVVRDESDEAILDGDPTYASWAAMPRLRGGYCYYVAFENTAEVPDSPLDAAAIQNATDDCGADGDGTCYYLAFDFNHRLHEITTGQLVAGNVIAGLTH